jgi:hypothetical protein
LITRVADMNLFPENVNKNFNIGSNMLNHLH